MKSLTLALTAVCLLFSLAAPAQIPKPEAAPATAPEFWAGVKGTIGGYLGKPYVWGSSGLKSFDCSGFVWRVMFDNGLLFKRTTARKLYLSLRKPAVGTDWRFGNIVFFDNLKHCGIVNDDVSFYHAQSSIGTNLSRLTPYWRARISGVRCFK